MTACSNFSWCSKLCILIMQSSLFVFRKFSAVKYGGGKGNEQKKNDNVYINYRNECGDNGLKLKATCAPYNTREKKSTCKSKNTMCASIHIWMHGNNTLSLHRQNVSMNALLMCQLIWYLTRKRYPLRRIWYREALQNAHDVIENKFSKIQQIIKIVRSLPGTIDATIFPFHKIQNLLYLCDLCHFLLLVVNKLLHTYFCCSSDFSETASNGIGCSSSGNVGESNDSTDDISDATAAQTFSKSSYWHTNARKRGNSTQHDRKSYKTKYENYIQHRN